MFGRLVAGLIVVGLAIGVWLLWPASEANPAATPTTLTPTRETSTTNTTTPTSSVLTTQVGGGVITTESEAEEVLRALWFGWFQGIYDQDEDRIREVVASQPLLENAISQFGAMSFESQPASQSLSFTNTEILSNDETCTVVWSEVDVPFRGGATDGAHVLRKTADGWKFVSVWTNKTDLWEQDCTAELEPLL